ncbi:uncharacterized protein [Amphiura filiformis]|uniref:uncharacterized protein n=1 Tax=Amphiura filiformis TaxID=82378 RepID=UPI003B21D325
MGLKFNGVRSNHLNWFSRSRLLSAPYVDMCDGNRTCFSASGHGLLGRQWFVNKMYTGCTEDSGWMVTTYSSNASCDWESTQIAKPEFMYSKRNTSTVWNTGDVGKASMLAIFVSTIDD